jgi:hypothetical protein
LAQVGLAARQQVLRALTDQIPYFHPLHQPAVVVVGVEITQTPQAVVQAAAVQV